MVNDSPRFRPMIKFSVWLAKPWSGAAHRKVGVVRENSTWASQLVLVNPDGPPVSGSRVLCGQKLVSTGGLMEFTRRPPELRACTHCERIYQRGKLGISLPRHRSTS